MFLLDGEAKAKWVARDILHLAGGRVEASYVGASFAPSPTARVQWQLTRQMVIQARG
jgi:hypothetical protein